jgi:hypothetical protein
MGLLLLLFKSGYQHRFLSNEAESNAAVRRSNWTGRTVELQRFVGTDAQRVDALRTVLSLSGRQPRLLNEIDKESELYRRIAPAFFDHVRHLATDSEVHQ